MRVFRLTMSLFFLVMVLFSNCKEEEKSLLTDEQLIGILSDLHVAEAAILSADRKTKDSIGNIYYQQIFEMHGVEDSLFYRELNKISTNPQKINDLYEIVNERIEQLNLEIKSDSVSTKK